MGFCNIVVLLSACYCCGLSAGKLWPGGNGKLMPDGKERPRSTIRTVSRLRPGGK